MVSEQLEPLHSIYCMQGGAHDKHARVREVAVHISDITLREGDRGAVIVGGSIELGDLAGPLQLLLNM